MRAQGIFHPPRHARNALRPSPLYWLLPAAALLFLALPLAAHAQVPGYYGYAQSPYAQSYAQPGYGQPQYAQPYAPGYAQPAYPQQYAQPGYGQPYAQPGDAQGYAQPQYAQPGQAQPSYPQQQYSEQADADDPLNGYNPAPQPAQAMSPDQLEQLVAPVALYPDGLIAQILAAATYPAQVAAADQWLGSAGYASPDQIAAGADAQNWDPSVKALTAFPQVLAEMARNLQWTTTLGNAYYNQPQDVLAAVQALRQRAQAAGNLQDTPQEQVGYDQGDIELAPSSPQYVYVPVYNPWYVYGAPIAPYPGFAMVAPYGSLIGYGAVRFCAGLAMSAFLHMPFGWLGWGLDWFGHGVLYQHAAWYSHSTTVAHWGGGFRGGPLHAGQGYLPGHAYAANHFTENRGVSQSFDRRFNQGLNRGYGSAFNNRGYGSAANSRGFGSSYGSYARPAVRQNYAYNSMPARPQQFGSKPSPSFYGGPAYAGRSGSFYGGAQNSWRGSASAPRTQAFAQRSYSMPSSRGFAGYSGGGRSAGSFRGFSGGHGGGKAPGTSRGGGGGGHRR